MTTSNAQKHRGSAARALRDMHPDAAAEIDEAIGASARDPEGLRPSATRVAIAGQKARTAAATASRKRGRVILNLLTIVRVGRLEALEQLGAWGEALAAARLIAETSDGLTLTSAGRAMLEQMPQKHAGSSQTSGSLASVASPARRIARRGSRSRGDQTTTLASS